MTFDDFRACVDGFFTGRFEYFQWMMSSGNFRIENGTLSFPTICVVSEFKCHYVAEFYGHAPKYQQLKWHTKTISKRLPVEVYFQQFSDADKIDVSFLQQMSCFIWQNVELVDACQNYNEAYRRLHIPPSPEVSRMVQVKEGLGTIKFSNKRCTTILVNMLLVNGRGRIVRAKWNSLAVIATKDKTVQELEGDFQNLNLRKGALHSPIENRMHIHSATDFGIITSMEFGSIYLSPSMRETAIGGYLLLKPEILIAALAGKRIYHEVQLDWQSGDNRPIRPDLLIERENGLWDICDLKTAELMQKSLVTGKPSRTRFKEVVMEGIAQLAHYAEYFKDSLNAVYAEKQFGIRVNNPELFLVVGERDNLPEADLIEASRMLDNNYRILDYDTIAEMYALRRMRMSDKGTAV